MNNSFRKELVWSNCIFIGGLLLMFVAANLYYGADLSTWLKNLPLMAVIALALPFKLWRLKKMGRELDERTQYLTYRAMAVGFFLLLAAVLWYYTREMVLVGDISTRTLVELIAAVVGYVGGHLILRRLY